MDATTVSSPCPVPLPTQLLASRRQTLGSTAGPGPRNLATFCAVFRAEPAACGIVLMPPIRGWRA